MENKNETKNKEKEVKKIDEIAVQGRIYTITDIDYRAIDPVKRKRGLEVQKVVIEIKHPFERSFPNVEVKFPKKLARNEGRFELKARREIETKKLAEIPLTAKVRLLEFKENYKRDMSSFLSIIIDSPFEDGEEKTYIVTVVEEKVKGVLLDYAREKLNVVTLEQQEQERKKRD
ncbi:MAG: hypothetical protein FWE22_08640 [Firmicutes bacterium]|nr:hypothetical protein [Bacillota bacterium]